MKKSVSDKMGIKQGMRAVFINAPSDASKAINPPELILQKMYRIRKQLSDDDIFFFFKKEIMITSYKNFMGERKLTEPI